MDVGFGFNLQLRSEEDTSTTKFSVVLLQDSWKEPTKFNPLIVTQNACPEGPRLGETVSNLAETTKEKGTWSSVKSMPLLLMSTATKPLLCAGEAHVTRLDVSNRPSIF
jgi:hypothetical protein